MTVAGFDKSFGKQPFEVKTIRAEMANVAQSLIVSGYILASVIVLIFDQAGLDVTSTLLNGTPSIDAVNYYVYATIQAGADGKDYFARFRTTWTKSGQPDQIDEKDLLIQVRQVGF